MSPEVRKTLLQWRVNEEARAYADIPRRLSSNEEHHLRRHWWQRKTELEAELDASRRKLQSELAAVSASFVREREHLDVQEAAAREKLGRAEVGLYREFADSVHRLAGELRSASRDVDALEVKLAAARRERAALHWAGEEATRALAAHEAIRFTRYLGVLLQDGQEPPPTADGGYG